MKATSEITSLLEAKAKNDLRKSTAGTSTISIKSNVMAKANPVLNIMNKAESEVLVEKKERLRAHNIYQLRPIPYRIDNIYSMSKSDTLLKLKEQRSDCDGYYTKSCKIPLVYFDMTEEEVLEAHTEWCRTHLEKMISNKSANMINYKTKEIKKLKEEIKNLKKLS